LTPSSYLILVEELKKGHFVGDISQFENIIIYNLRKMTIEEIANLPDVSEGLENLIKKAANSCNTIDEFINIVSSKRYTQTRIKRILIYALLNITKKDMAISKKTNPYIRVLGCNEKGKEMLSKISKANPKVTIVTSVKRFMENNINKNLKVMMDKDIEATNIYTLGYANDSWSNLDYTKKIKND
jgi:predicted nucleotidyltransferase